jgi:hypothetical protein
MRGRAPVGQEPEPVGQMGLDLRRRQGAQPGRGQLDRQRQAIQLPADAFRRRYRNHLIIPAAARG